LVLASAISVFAAEQTSPQPAPGKAAIVAEPAKPVTPVQASEPELSPALKDLVRLAKTGLDEAALIAFVESFPLTFQAGADQVVYLRQLKVPSRVIISVLRHDGFIARGVAPVLLPEPAEPGEPVGQLAVEEGTYVPLPEDEEAIEDDPTAESPVRRPYPVKLLDTIVVYRTEGRPPNIQVIRMP
jgi:hypothetical protein